MKALLLAILLVQMASVGAQQIDVAALGKLDLRYQQGRQIDEYSGRPLAATVTFKPGEAFSLDAPRRVQQVEYLIGNGQLVEKGEPLTVLSGPEVHHFLLSFDTSERQLALLKRRYDANRVLYENKAIQESQWIEVSERYYAARLEHEHSRHFHQLVLSTDDDREAMTIAAPVGGIVEFAAGRAGVAMGETIALIIPPQALRLKVEVAIQQREQLMALRWSQCRVAIDGVERISTGFFATAWSEAPAPDCALLPGQQLLVEPVLSGPVLAIKRSAVMQWQGRTAVILRNAGKLTPRPVELLQAAGDDYLIRADQSLTGSDILVTSVSAVQGILLGLGGE